MDIVIEIFLMLLIIQEIYSLYPF